MSKTKALTKTRKSVKKDFLKETFLVIKIRASQNHPGYFGAAGHSCGVV
jgi:hypothetical protein